MSHEKFDKEKAALIAQGLNPKGATLLAAMRTGESDGSVELDAEQDSSNWSEQDWYQHNLKIGMNEADARFVAQVETGVIDINENEVDY